MAIRRRKTRLSRRTRHTLNIKVKPTVAREIWAIIYLALGVLTVLSIQGGLGVIGDLWMRMLSPVIGWGRYIIPGVFMLLSAMMFFSKKISFGASRTIGIILFMISVLSVLHLSVPIEEIHNYAELGRHGGYTGFVTNFLLLEVLGIGRVGAAVIFVAMFLVSLVLIFEVPLMVLISFLIPRIKIQMVKGGVEGKGKGFSQSENLPEIMIRKSLIENGDSKKGDVIYADDEQEKEKMEPVKLQLNKGAAVKGVEESLTENERKTEEEEYEWEFPSLDLLKTGDSNVVVDDDILMKSAEKIKQKLRQFGIEVAMHEVNVGPTVIQYTLKPHEAVKLSKITTLKNDIALALAAERVRIEAPIPGRSLVGIEVPNSLRATVHLREILESAEFKEADSKLTLPLGRDVSGKPVVGNLEGMPHLLIAGATGSGKSVAMNSFLISLLYQNAPKDLKMIMIDPKRVELNSYNSIPHLLSPVIQDPEKAAISLRWVVAEMVRRYGELSARKVRNIVEFNELKDVNKLPRIVVVIDELADLMMAAGKEVEASICRIAQMARAVGIHLLIATQRPSVDVITGLIKANIPSRIAFAVASQIDSRTILDGAGAEDLLGRGDMLYLPTGQNKPVRIQGIYVSTEEIERVTNRVKLTIEPNYDESITSVATAKQRLVGVPDSDAAEAGMDEDNMYEDAFKLVMETRKASASLLQRRLKVGYARAARLIDILEANGVVGPADGAKPRRIMVD
ncbi:DNA translocase FtsK 4TM domain-containing protein [Candidatus Peregrinibacteria bacterium]|nr:DNA translocase FtsK 4TM domain-containing protein [Candidatus Peregrinibacteria bacterium]